MKKRIFGVVVLALVMCISLTSCALLNTAKDIFNGIFNPSVALEADPLDADMLINFEEGANPDVLFESDGWSNGDVFNVVWKQHNVHYENGIMRLGITEEKVSAWLNDAEVEFDYSAGEARTQNYYHYGDYEVSMKPSANPGTASTFFTCTGPYDLKDGEPNPHDEIDIEFLGSDTTHVQFNFFVDGKGGNEYMHNLGFDASEEFHEYGYRWTETSITWFVDDVPVYMVTTDTSVTPAGNVRIVEKIPQTPGRILTNYWCGNERAVGWMGLYTGETKDSGTEYQWIATSAEGAPLNAPVEPPVGGDDTEIDWSAIEPIAPEFPSAAPYEVTVDGNKANVTYTDVSGSAYMPIELDVTDAVAGKNYVYMKVTNNGSETVNVRVNMFDPTLTGNNKATNISATMNGEAVRTDLDWGGSFFDIPAGESAELVVCFGVGGVKLQLMIDSSRNDSTLRSGDVTVEDIKFAAVGEVEIPHKCEDANDDGKCDGCGEDMPLPPPPAPADPESGNLTTTIGGSTVQLGGNTSDGYGVHGNDDGTIRVEYTNISTNTYKNVWADVTAVAEGKNEISLKIKNNGEATAYITVKIEATGAVALMEGKMEIPAGEEKTYTGTFSGVAEKLYFFIDSGWSTDNTTHAGEVVISEIAFSGESGGDPVDPPAGGDDPVTPPADEGLQLNFWTSSSDYTANGNNIKYNGAGNSYSCAGADIASLAAGKTTFTVTITNNGTANSRVRVDIQGTTQVGNHTVVNTGATGGDVWTDSDWGGSTVTVAPGESVTLVITYDEYTERGAVTNLVVFVDSGRGDAETYSSDITLSGMAFSGESTPPAVETKPEDVQVNISDLETGTTTDAPIANGISASAGLSIDTNSKTIDGFTFTKRLKLGGTMKVDGGVVKAGVKIVTADKATIVVYAISSSSSDNSRTLQLATLTEGALVKLAESEGVPGDAVAKFEFTVDAAGEYYLGSTNSGINLYYIAVEYAAEGSDPVDPPAVEPVEGEYLSFTGNECYTLSATSEQYVNSIGVTYTAVSDNSYQNVNTWIKDKAADKTTLGVTIKNNGSETVKITVKLEAAGAVALGEYKVELAAGETQTVSGEFSGEAELLFFFIDSGWAEATATHAGDITISGINFK